MGKSQNLYKKAKMLIPGGTQLLSKRPEMFLPDLWPAYYSKASGCRVWDLDDRVYYDMSYMGIGANVLGYADKDVNIAVKAAVDSSSMCTLNAPEEVELAELLIELNPWAEKVRYAKTGGEANSIAIRIARAYTGKDVVLFCGYHGWSDWYLAANLAEDTALDGHLLQGLSPKGVPRGLIGSSMPFNYNHIEELNKLINLYEDKIAAVIMEPIRNNYPKDGFLEEIRNVTETKGIVLIFDEITSGFRLNCGGAHQLLKVNPDIAVFGKAISNGYPMAAIVGKDDIMEAAQETFISSTYWTDRLGLAASIACINKYKSMHVEKHLDFIGKLVQDSWIKAAHKAGLNIHVSGINPLGHFEFLYENNLELKTLFTQEMLKRGYLATTAFYASLSHEEEIVNKYLEEVEEVFELLKSYIDQNTVEDHLESHACHSGFQRLT
jgi:glutamate-1-semialdehyde 2,1-aminomutase